jgi:hypothetical protein
VIGPNPVVTGRSTLFASVDVLDHERGEWTAWLPDEVLGAASAEDLVQSAVDGGWDDIRLVVHVSGAAPRE